MSETKECVCDGWKPVVLKATISRISVCEGILEIAASFTGDYQEHVICHDIIEHTKSFHVGDEIEVGLSFGKG